MQTPLWARLLYDRVAVISRLKVRALGEFWDVLVGMRLRIWDGFGFGVRE